LVTSRFANQKSGCAGPFLVSEHPGAFADEQLLRRYYSPSMLTLYTHVLLAIELAPAARR